MVSDLFNANSELQRSHAEQMRRQGLVGWVLYHPLTGIVLHIYQTLRGADAAAPSLSARHGVSFRTLALNSQGVAYEHVGAKATRAALNTEGRAIRVPLHGRRIDRRGLRHFVPATQQRCGGG